MGVHRLLVGVHRVHRMQLPVRLLRRASLVLHTLAFTVPLLGNAGMISFPSFRPISACTTSFSYCSIPSQQLKPLSIIQIYLSRNSSAATCPLSPQVSRTSSTSPKTRALTPRLYLASSSPPCLKRCRFLEPGGTMPPTGCPSEDLRRWPT